jgi:hypothetical protein
MSCQSPTNPGKYSRKQHHSYSNNNGIKHIIIENDGNNNDARLLLSSFEKNHAKNTKTGEEDILVLVTDTDTDTDQWQLLLHEIRNEHKTFSFSRLYYNAIFTEKHSIGDKFFGRDRNIQWILANKFIIATQYKMPVVQVLGANTNRISRTKNNIQFFIDEQQYICAVLTFENINNIVNIKPSNNKNNKKKESVNANAINIAKNDFCANIVQHCTEMDLAIVEHYQGYNNNNQNQDLKNQSSSNKKSGGWRKNWQPKYADNIYLIRIPGSYYRRHMRYSFYEFCCEFTKYLISIHAYSHPLFALFMTTIARFDCFQMCLPLVPLSGNLREMYAQYVLGQYFVDDDNEKNSASNNINSNNNNKNNCQEIGDHDIHHHHHQTCCETETAKEKEREKFEEHIINKRCVSKKTKTNNKKKGISNETIDSFIACYHYWQITRLNRACSTCLYSLSPAKYEDIDNCSSSNNTNTNSNTNTNNNYSDLMAIIIEYAGFNEMKCDDIYTKTKQFVAENPLVLQLYRHQISSL